MTADRARGALAVLQDADGKFICEVPCGYIVEQTASAHKPRRIQAQRRRRAMDKKTAPCMGCRMRREGCHGICFLYDNWKHDRKAAPQSEKEIAAYVRQGQIRTERYNHKNRRH